jgi:nicotinate phosphoribosyltransferase
MDRLASLYRPSLSLLTDLYQLTMAYGYWRHGRAEVEAVFHLSFRGTPFKGGYAIAAGLADVIDYLEHFAFDEPDLAYLRTLSGNDGRPLFDPPFLDYLRNLRLELDVDAIPEGTAVFGHEPLVRVKGPILQCQLIETPLLALMNFPTLIATKSARICQAARGEPVLEFGLRRAQGIDGALTAARAAYIGGAAATSNVLAGRLFDIPVRGTHAHSWVMSFGDEVEAFEAYAQAQPNNCVLLVDTYDTLEGVRRAAEVGRRLASRGHRMIGIRLDSGDLAYLSIEARKILDAAGLADAQILASNDLDEHIIAALKQQDARITIWGVGTKLVTAYDQPALGGVYKLGSVRDGRDGAWVDRIKLSETVAKISIPGELQVRRYRVDGCPVADQLYHARLGVADPPSIVDPADPTRRRVIEKQASCEDLLEPVFRAGRRVYAMPELRDIRARARAELDSLHPSLRRLLNPHEYPVGLDPRLHDLRMELIGSARASGGQVPVPPRAAPAG